MMSQGATQRPRLTVSRTARPRRTRAFAAGRELITRPRRNALERFSVGMGIEQPARVSAARANRNVRLRRAGTTQGGGVVPGGIADEPSRASTPATVSL